jgi:nucleoside-diphosphate-sugar epimerase
LLFPNSHLYQSSTSERNYMSILLVGCGYLGSRVGARWLAAGEEVSMITRSEENAKAFAQQGYKPIVADVTEPATLTNLPPVQIVLYAVGYDRQSGASIDDVYVTGLRNVLNQLPAPARVVYISTTGVYGPGESGSWVDESSPCEPTRPGGKASLAAEQLLAAHPNGANRVVLRMAGLYGPGRLPLAAQVRTGEPVPAEPEAYLNLIHIDDAAQVVVLAAKAEKPANCYCVSDGRPVLRRDFYEELARLLAAPSPTFALPESAGASTRRGSGDKRISNERLVGDLAVRFEYPSYIEGLTAICSSS